MMLDEDAMTVGAAMYAAMAIEYLALGGSAAPRANLVVSRGRLAQSARAHPSHG